MMIKTILQVPQAISQQLSSADTFEALMQMPGKAFRDVPGRKTVQVQIGGESYFIKQHFGVGWAEIFKNLISFKTPILGAMTEVRAIQKLDEIGIPTTPLVAYGQRGCSPASMRSFIVTEDLGDILTLEDVFRAGLEAPPNKASRPAVLQALAQLATKLHDAGLCHRDFYLCHFVVKKTELKNGNLNLHLIDLHRMLQGQQPNSSAVMKDVAGLYFSMQQVGLGVEDWAIFKQYYLPQSDGFWGQVDVRSQALLAKFNSEKFQKRLAEEKSALD
jgi:UDP-glucose:(heptosyl)LPS alpha-1,3-glucosyltransferase/heptose I phosphotransferase